MPPRSLRPAAPWTRRAGLLAAWGALVALGCAFSGPGTVRVGRGLYNEAVQRTDNEQLLLNLVRLRYSDTPFFLEVTSVSTNFTFVADGEVAVLVPSGGSSLFDLGLGGSVAENPTVTYTPVDGDQFVRELLSPIDMPTLLLLLNSGWGTGRVVRVCLQSINGVPNAPSGSGPTPQQAPEFRVFQRAAALLKALDDRGALSLGMSEDEDDIVLRVADDEAGAPELAELRRILKLRDDTLEYIVTDDLVEAGPAALHVVTRSVLSALFYLSHNVDAPADHVEAGLVGVSRHPTGDAFDWDAVSGDLFQIRVSDDEPEGAYTAVPYRDHWFYIADADRSSKSTFGLLSTLFMLQSRGVDPDAPVLTLPVSR